MTAWKKKYPPHNWPVIAFTGAPAPFPVRKVNLHLHKYLFNWNENINELAEKFTKELIDKGAKLIGLGARDTLRLEAGLCLYGHDINESTSPIEANLKWAISKRRREEGGFPGYEKIKSDMNGQLTRLRVGIKPEGKVIAREGTKIFSEDNQEIGSVTSGTFGPTLNSSIAMGYVKYNFSKAGTKIFLEVRGKKHEARISELPFYKKKYVR